MIKPLGKKERLNALEREIKERKTIYDDIEKKFGKDTKKDVKQYINHKLFKILLQKDEKTAAKKKESNQPALESEEQTLKIIEKLNVVIDTFKHRFENQGVNYKENPEIIK